MAEKKFTLLEVHLGDGHVQFGPKSIDTRENDERESAAEGEGDDEDVQETSDGRSLLPLLFGLLALAVVAAAAKKLTGSDDVDDLEALDEMAAEA
jgi:hypothetical protein